MVSALIIYLENHCSELPPGNSPISHTNFGCLYLKLHQAPGRTEYDYPLLGKHLVRATSTLNSGEEAGGARLSSTQHVYLEALQRCYFPPVSGQTNPNTSGEQAQEKDKGRHVQTWDSGMMGDFI